MAPIPPASESAGRRGKRIALVIFVAIAAAFILSSTWQIYRQVFGGSVAKGQASLGCSIAARSFEEQIDRALTEAARMHTPESARDAFNDSLQNAVGLANVEKRCVAGPADRDTHVAAQRLLDTAATAAEHQAADLARVRRAIEALAER